MARPTILSHLLALLMPLTMAVFVPAWFLSKEGDLSTNILERSAGSLLIIVGFALFASTLRLFISSGNGTLAPWDATKNFIVTGPYKYCRNPMITGVLFVILGEALLFTSATLLFWGLMFFVVNTFYFILSEEPDLSSKFGKLYDDYKRHVPRWIPLRRPYNK